MESYPFDWIYSYPEMIIDCIENNFTKFLDNQYYSLGTNTTEQKHLYYFPVKSMFHHHNPKKPEDYDYFKRCVNRFQNILKSNEKKLFIILYENQTQSLDQRQKEFIMKFNNDLAEYTNNYTLLYIHHYPNNKRYHNLTTYNNIDFLDISTESNSDGIKFFDSQDNDYINNILKNRYSFDLFNKDAIIEKKDL